MKDTLPLIEFNPKLPKLSKNESQVLKLLVEAGKLIAPIYLEQEKQAQIKLNKKEIEKAAKKDLNILSPYTVIEKIKGKITAIPYHIKYANLLAPVVQKLNEAANITENKEFGRALKIQATALMSGSYEEALAAWLKLEPYVLDVSISPVDHFDDKLFFGKASYQAWVGTLDREGTDRFNNYKSATLSIRRNALIPNGRIDPQKIKARMIDVILLSGLMARQKFVGINIPIDVNFIEKYGADITLFNQANDLRLQEQILPAFNHMFSRMFREGFSKEDLRRGYLRCTALHELAHSYLYYKNAAKNLQDLFPTIYELAATILGLRLAGSLLLKERITEKQLEAMIIAFLCRNMFLVSKIKIDKPMLNYAIGGMIFINFILESRALRQLDNLFVPNFTKIFFSIHELSLILEQILARGTKNDAGVFIKKYSTPIFFTKNVFHNRK